MEIRTKILLARSLLLWPFTGWCSLILACSTFVNELNGSEIKFNSPLRQLAVWIISHHSSQWKWQLYVERDGNMKWTSTTTTIIITPPFLPPAASDLFTRRANSLLRQPHSSIFNGISLCSVLSFNILTLSYSLFIQVWIILNCINIQ